MRNIEVPQAFAYMGDLQQKKIKAQTFKRGEPGIIWDPKVIRLCLQLPYMKAVPMPDAAKAAVAKTKQLQEATAEKFDVPANWKDLHHKKQMALAKRLVGPTADVSTVVQAREILAMHAPKVVEPVAGPDVDTGEDA